MNECHVWRFSQQGRHWLLTPIDPSGGSIFGGSDEGYPEWFRPILDVAKLAGEVHYFDDGHAILWLEVDEEFNLLRFPPWIT